MFVFSPALVPLDFFFSVFSSFVYSQTVSMNQEVQMFKLQIEKWILVIYRGLLPVGETKCLYLLLLWADSDDISASVGRLIEETVPATSNLMNSNRRNMI